MIKHTEAYYEALKRFDKACEDKDVTTILYGCKEIHYKIKPFSGEEKGKAQVALDKVLGKHSYIFEAVIKCARESKSSNITGPELLTTIFAQQEQSGGNK